MMLEGSETEALTAERMADDIYPSLVYFQDNYGASVEQLIVSGVRNLDKLSPGDQVMLYTQQRQYVYIVDRTELVEPTAVEVMASTGAPTVTLISCYPYLVDKQRIVVFARLQN